MTERRNDAVRRRRIATNGISLDVVEAGRRSDPVVLLCHGFPESSHSWRHQMRPLADAGYHVLAPDQRGYGTSESPSDVDAYGIDELGGDLLGLLDDVDAQDAVLVGHDWGALVAWDLARLHPERINSLVAMSVPFTPWPAQPTRVLRHIHGDNFFYILYFQDVGPAEAELGADIRRSLHHILWSASGDNFPLHGVERSVAGTSGWLDELHAPEDLDDLPVWLTSADLDTFVDAFSTNGFFGPVSWYRNFDANYERLAPFPASRMTMPTLFVAGSNDLVIHGHPERIEAMQAELPNLRDIVILDGVGHWTQQEDPDGVNAALLGFLASR